MSDAKSFQMVSPWLTCGNKVSRRVRQKRHTVRDHGTGKGDKQKNEVSEYETKIGIGVQYLKQDEEKIR